MPSTISTSTHPIIIDGTHIIIDISQIENYDILQFKESIIDILDKIVVKFNLSVVGKVLHQFEPFGVTGVYVLSESHLSIHTFVEEKKVAMDLYTCKSFNETKQLISFLDEIFNPCKIQYKVISRL